MTNSIIFCIAIVLIFGMGFVFSFIVVPKMPSEVLEKASLIQKLVSQWVYDYVADAATMSGAPGAAKKEYVTQEVKQLLNKYKIDMSDNQVSALIESAYSMYKVAVKEINKEKERQDNE